MRKPHFLFVLGLSSLLVPVLIPLASCTTDLTSITSGDTSSTLFNLPPTVVLTSDIVRGVAPLTVRFSSSGSTDDGVIVEREWDFGDDTTSLDIAPTHVFEQTGTYVVSLTLTDDDGSTTTETLDIDVTDQPIAIIAVDRTSAESAPAIFNFDGSASYDPDAETGDELDFRWNFDDGSIATTETVRHTFARSGTYLVELVVTDEIGVTGRDSLVIEVGIVTPEIVFRAPLDEIDRLACSTDSLLWAHADYEVETGVPYTLRAGLDGDNDPCEAQTTLFDPRTGETIETLDGHDDIVRTAAFSPDGAYVLSGSDDGTARLYETETGLLVRQFAPGAGTINSLAFAPGGGSFVVGTSDGSVMLYGTATGVRIDFPGHAAAVNAVAFSPAANQIASGAADGEVVVWNVADTSEAARFVHAEEVTAVAFWPTNPLGVLTGSVDHEIRLWSAVDGGVLQQLSGHTDAVRSVAFSSDGLQVLSGSDDDTARLWNLLTGTTLRSFTGHTDDVLSAAFSPDDLEAITGSADGTAIIWEIATGGEVRTLQPCISPITAVAYSMDGALVLTGVAAQNDIQLDTDPAQGNDLNLTLPTALILTDVPPAQGVNAYYLWAEIDTDRTTPSRSYANARVDVFDGFASTDAGAPQIDLIEGEEVGIVVPASTRPPQRQVIDIGALDEGDLLNISLMTVPGYGGTYEVPGYSLQILDENLNLVGWYQDDFTLFTAETRFVIGADSEHHYIALDDSGYNNLVPSVRVSVDRGFATDSQPRKQYVFLQFGAVSNLAIQNSVPANLAAFDYGTDPEAVKAQIVARIQTLFAAYDVEVSTTVPTAPVYSTIYFDTAGAILTDGGIEAADLLLYGLPDFFDPRNETLSGFAAVIVSEIEANFALLNDAARGNAIGSAAAHQIALLAGLRQTTGLATDVMNANADLTSLGLAFLDADANLADHDGVTPLGTQNADKLLLELFGPN